MSDEVITIAVVILYIAVVIGIGYYYYHRSENLSDYILGGRTLPLCRPLPLPLPISPFWAPP